MELRFSGLLLLESHAEVFVVNSHWNSGFTQFCWKLEIVLDSAGNIGLSQNMVPQNVILYHHVLHLNARKMVNKPHVQTHPKIIALPISFYVYDMCMYLYIYLYIYMCVCV